MKKESRYADTSDRTRSVFPVPGGPNRRMPRGGRIPRERNASAWNSEADTSCCSARLGPERPPTAASNTPRGVSLLVEGVSLLVEGVSLLVEGVSLLIEVSFVSVSLLVELVSLLLRVSLFMGVSLLMEVSLFMGVSLLMEVSLLMGVSFWGWESSL